FRERRSVTGDGRSSTRVIPSVQSGSYLPGRMLDPPAAQRAHWTAQQKGRKRSSQPAFLATVCHFVDFATPPPPPQDEDSHDGNPPRSLGPPRWWRFLSLSASRKRREARDQREPVLLGTALLPDGREAGTSSNSKSNSEQASG